MKTRDVESEFARLEREFTKTREHNVCTSYKGFCEALKQQQIIREKEFQGLLKALVLRDKKILAEVKAVPDKTSFRPPMIARRFGP